jgi:hypothetical protein
VLNGTGLLANQVNAQYQWYSCFNNALILLPGDTNQLFQPSLNGYYTVAISIGNCADTLDCTLVQDISLEENEAPRFNLFPNPNQGSFTIQNLANTDFKHFEIYDAKGARIALGSLESNSLSFKLASGIYTLHLIDARGRRSIQRFLVQE